MATSQPALEASDNRVRFDKTITLGSLIQIIALVLALVAAYNNLSNRITSLETKLDVVYRLYLLRYKSE